MPNVIMSAATPVVMLIGVAALVPVIVTTLPTPKPPPLIVSTPVPAGVPSE